MRLIAFRYHLILFGIIFDDVESKNEKRLVCFDLRIGDFSDGDLFF